MFRIVLLAFWFIFIFARHVISMKVFSFNSTDDESDQFSSAVLVSSPKEALPEKFIACFSMKQDKIDNSSPFLIRDINKQPWIAPSVWNSGGLGFLVRNRKARVDQVPRVRNPLEVLEPHLRRAGHGHRQHLRVRQRPRDPHQKFSKTEGWNAGEVVPTAGDRGHRDFVEIRREANILWRSLKHPLPPR